MSQVSTDSVTDYAHLRFEPGDASAQPMRFQTQEGTNGQPNMIALGLSLAMLGLFNACVLFKAAVVSLYLPSDIGVLGALCGCHIHMAGGPVFSVAVFAHGLEYCHPPISFQVHASPFPR